MLPPAWHILSLFQVSEISAVAPLYRSVTIMVSLQIIALLFGMVGCRFVSLYPVLVYTSVMW